MMSRNLLIISTILAWCMSACQPTVLAPREFLQWVENPANGFNNQREIGQYTLGAQLMPIPYQAVQLHQASLNAHHLNEMKAELKESLDIHFTMGPQEGNVSFLKYNLGSIAEYQERLTYLSFDMEDYLYLLHGNDTLRPNLYHFERSFDLEPDAHFFLSFPRPEQLEEEAILILDDHFFGLGPVRFRFDLGRLSHLPALNLQS
ncbi:MAG: hypothetical protein AAF927_17155 [Bacteroidota bacterium]